MMIVATWFLYCLFTAAVLTGAAYVWEKGARWSGSPARWGWLAALTGSVTLPWLTRLLPAQAAEALPVAIPVIALDPLVLEASAAAGALSAADVALFAWATSSLVVLGWVTFALFRLGRQRREWRETELEGGRVLVARSVGPAAVGVRTAQVVVPSWALHLDGELRGLLLRHEREHVRAGDPRLLFAALVLLAAMPWNPLVWLQVLRLRNAIELDCDARVLSNGADPERYGSLLLEVGRRRSSGAFVMATFAEPRVFLEQRIRRIAGWPSDRRPLRAAVFALAGLVLFATALSARDPLRTGALPATSSAAEIPVDRELLELVMPSDTPPAQPTFTPMTDRPELSNRDEVVAALLANYPPLLRDAGIGGAPTVWMYIDERGRVTKAQMSRSSGYPALDEAAVNVASVMQFSPALNNGARVPVWIEIPIIFKADGSQLRETEVPQPQARAQPRAQPVPERRPTESPQPQLRIRELPAPDRIQNIAEGPVFTPMTQRPELKNRDEVARALIEAYPPMLRDAGIGGSPVVWFFITEEGHVKKAQISKSSGYPALDRAALEVAAGMQFTPAKNRDRDVPVWVEIPIVFTAK